MLPAINYRFKPEDGRAGFVGVKNLDRS
jgi:hypothetical protein